MQPTQTDSLRVYWRPGCSSCVKVKEFLARLGLDYESIDVAARPAAMDELRELGARSVPVVARGREYVFAQELADVARFVGRRVEFERLPAPALVERWLALLAAARKHVMQIPAERLGEPATEGRDRSVRDLAYHIHQIPDAFLQAVLEGNGELAEVYNAPPPAGVATAADVRAYGERIAARLADWWRERADKSCAGKVETYYGTQPLHHLLERCVWHSAQHVRQVVAVLDRCGIAAEPPVGAEDFAGLPMPEGLWE